MGFILVLIQLLTIDIKKSSAELGLTIDTVIGLRLSYVLNS